MKFTPTRIDGLLLIEPSPSRDARGSFARLWCAETFAKAGYSFVPVQISSATNTRAATLRGLHWQTAPHGETKLIRVMRGRIWDVIVDLRAGSPTKYRWEAFELDAASGRTLLVPRGCAHGYITLEDDTEVLYAMDVPQAPDFARGARWNDKLFGINWPIEPRVISERDANWPDYRGEEAP